MSASPPTMQEERAAAHAYAEACHPGGQGASGALGMVWTAVYHGYLAGLRAARGQFYTSDVADAAEEWARERAHAECSL